MSVGFLYTKIDAFGARSIEKLSSAHVNARFRFFLDKVGMDNNNQGDLKLSIHSLRAGKCHNKSSGGAISKEGHVRCVLEKSCYSVEVSKAVPSFIPVQGFWCAALCIVPGGLFSV